MDSNELIQKAKLGDMGAFSEWMDKHSRRIELFIIQNGYRETAANLTAVVFNEFLNKLPTIESEEQGEVELFRLAVNLLAKPNVMVSEESILKFEEDELLHKAITHLKSDVKIPFVLAVFHKKSLDEIVALCGGSKAEVQQKIKQAELMLPSENLVKKVGFLEKSYNRVQLRFKKENVLKSKDEEVKLPFEKKTKMGKKTLLIWAIGILLLVAIVTVPVVTSEEYRTSSAEKYVEKLSASFEKEIQKKYDIVGLVELDETESNGNYFEPFGKNARFQFSVLESNVKRQIDSGFVINKEKIENEYNEILQELELPSEMVARVIANPLLDSEEESEKFIKRYIDTYSSIQNQYYYVISQYEEELGKALETADFDREKFLSNKKTYPKELQNLINATEVQNIELQILPEMMYVLPVFMENGTAEKISESLYGNMGGYMALIQSPTYYYADVESLDLTKIYSDLLSVEETLMNSKEADDLYQQLKSVYVSMFEVLSLGYDPDKRFGSDGTLKDKYRTIMKTVAKNENTNSPSAFAMKRVIEFIETNEWKRIENSNYLSYPMYDLIDQAREGNLESFVWPTIEEYEEMYSDESIEEESVGYQQGITEREDPDYKAAVLDAYQSIATYRNRDALINVKPIVVLGVYLLANEQEDPASMWLLHNRETVNMTKNEYVKSWKKQSFEIANAEIFYAEEEGNESNGVPLIPIQYELNGETIYDGWLKWNEDSQIWEIEIAPERMVENE